jgi:NAD(P)-dependent dehydrogenase (short-subunit alcohol dehydrogenase family)
MQETGGYQTRSGFLISVREAMIANIRGSNMHRKTALITGANRSIGFETARQLGREGYIIWLGSRDGVRGEEAARSLSAEAIEVRPLSIDVTDAASVRQAAARVEAEDGKLDVLINNAGISSREMTAPSQQSVEDIRHIYETNVFAPVRVTQAFLPLLRNADTPTSSWSAAGLARLAGCRTRKTSSTG